MFDMPVERRNSPSPELMVELLRRKVMQPEETGVEGQGYVDANPVGMQMLAAAQAAGTPHARAPQARRSFSPAPPPGYGNQRLMEMNGGDGSDVRGDMRAMLIQMLLGRGRKQNQAFGRFGLGVR